MKILNTKILARFARNTKYLVAILPILILFIITPSALAIQIGGGTTEHPEKISGSLEVTSGITFNGIYYNWPALQGGTSTYLQNDGTGGLSWSALGGVLVSMEVIAAGTTSYTPTAGISSIVVECVAGGGGGGGVASGASTASAAAGGGGGGSYGRKYISSPAASYTVSVGTGGGGGSGGGNNPGNPGNSTTFGDPAIITCNGGQGGAGGGTAGTGALFTVGGAGGAVSTGGDINIGGQAGAPGIRKSGTVYASGNGGSSFFGGGAVGLIATGKGNDAASYGAGGSGACVQGNLVAGPGGGAGSDGVMVIWEFK